MTKLLSTFLRLPVWTLNLILRKYHNFLCHLGKSSITVQLMHGALKIAVQKCFAFHYRLCVNINLN